MCFFVIGMGEGVPITRIYCVALGCDGDNCFTSRGFQSRSPSSVVDILNDLLSRIRVQDSARRVINRCVWSRSQAVQGCQNYN